MQLVLIFTFLSLAIAAAWVAYSRRPSPKRRQGGGGELPPGPPPLPIFGNIFQLGANPHKSLSQLAKTYGPLMSLKLGTQFTVVASSPEMAKEILQKQGLPLSKSFNPVAICVHGHEQVSVAMLPATSDRWKKLRRIAREHLFSNHALQAGQSLRRERLQKLADHVSSCGGDRRPMNVGEAAFTTMSNLIFATLFSVEFSDYGAPDNNLKAHVSGFTRYMGHPNISDFFPILAPLDPQGLRRKITHHLGSVLEIVQGMIEQRLKQRAASSSTGYQKRNDFLETLLDLVEGNEYDLSIKEIKHLFVDLIIAGTDTSSATTEWAMLELLLHPQKLAKVKAELKSVIGEKRIIEESDISKLPYLLATIKEVFRYHPAAPLLVPHQAEEETQVKGYVIPKNSTIFVNFWATTRDPSIWKDPESFEPERFLGNNVDFQGQHPELIPFGSGRRICPGIPLASRMLHCMVATLCHNFDWELVEDDAQVQREDVFGLALQKKKPLWAIPIKV